MENKPVLSVEEMGKVLLMTAKENMRNDGYVSPALIALDENGGMLGIMAIHEAHPDQYNEVAKAFAQKVMPHALFIVHEAWVARIDAKDAHKPFVRPSQDPKRIEVVVVNGIDRNNVHYGYYAETVREGDAVVGFGDDQYMKATNDGENKVQCRFFDNVWDEQTPDILN